MRETLPTQPAVEIAPAREFRPAAMQTSAVLELVFVVLFAQMAVLIVLSLVMQEAPMFVGRDPARGFGMDFYDFYQASTYHANGVNAYLEKRFVTPPFSLLIGLPFGKSSFSEARYLFFVVNLSCLVAALAAFAQQVKFSARETGRLLMIAAVYYPVLFLLDRGNIDGVVLALLVFAFRTRHRLLSIVLFGTSAALKLYSGLLAFAFARQKRWGLAAGGIFLAVALQLPWWNLAVKYPAILATRSGRFLPVENISPALVVGTILTAFHLPAWQWVYASLWMGTLAWAVAKISDDAPANWVLFTPWMTAMPFVVYPYSLVLALPLLAYIAAQSRKRPWDVATRLVVVGFLLTGTQQMAWVLFLRHFTKHVLWVYQLNALGTTLLVAGCILLASRRAQNGNWRFPVRLPDDGRTLA